MTVRLVGRAVALGSLSVLVALGGCGGDDGAGGTDGASDVTGEQEPPPTGACTLLTLDEVSALFGEEARIVAGPDGEPAASTCFWEAAEGDGDFPTRHQLQLSVFDDGGTLDPTSWGEAPEPIDGLGDEAYVVPAGFLGTTAGYRDGDEIVTMSYAIVAGEEGPDPADKADDVVELLRAVAERSG